MPIQDMTTDGIYIHWDRFDGTGSNIRYDIYRSASFDVGYSDTAIGQVVWPQDYYVDTTGLPSYYYIIKEVDYTDELNPIILHTTQPVVGEEILVLDSLLYSLGSYGLLNMPIYDEECVFTKGRTQGYFTFPDWDYRPRPEIRISSASQNGGDAFIILDENVPIYSTIDTNPVAFTSNNDVITTTDLPHGFTNHDPIKFLGSNLPAELNTADTYYVLTSNDIFQFSVGATVEGTAIAIGAGEGCAYKVSTTLNYPKGLKYKLDYQGKVYFINEDNNAIVVQPYDMVYATYYTRLFTGQEINNAAYLALQRIAIEPGTNKYVSLAGAPLYYDPVIVTGALYYLIRGLLLRLGKREVRLLLEDPDKNEMMGFYKDLAKQLEELFEKECKKIAISRYPRAAGIVTPEYQMPGGRSRFFRYAWRATGYS